VAHLSPTAIVLRVIFFIVLGFLMLQVYSTQQQANKDLQTKLQAKEDELLSIMDESQDSASIQEDLDRANSYLELCSYIYSDAFNYSASGYDHCMVNYNVFDEIGAYYYIVPNKWSLREAGATGVSTRLSADGVDIIQTNHTVDKSVTLENILDATVAYGPLEHPIVSNEEEVIDSENVKIGETETLKVTSVSQDEEYYTWYIIHDNLDFAISFSTKVDDGVEDEVEAIIATYQEYGPVK